MTYVTTGVPVAVHPARGRKKGVVVPPHPSGQEHQAELWQTLWPDSYRGGMLVFRTKEHRDIVSQLEYAPLGRVPKYDHEGREKEKGRMIHDCSYGEDSVNARTQDEAYPAVWLPVFEALVRAILRWKVLYPGVPVLVTKRDVDAAFRRLVIHLEGVELFAAELGEYTIVLVVLSFGWAASPRAYSVISDAISAFHNGHRPAETDVNGRQLFVSFTYVDDGMLVEPDIGYRPWASGQVYERGVVVALGEDAVSQSKKEAEGRWSVEATLLGIITNTADETVTLPYTAIAKGRRELQAPQWARCCTTVTLHAFQKLVGRLYRVTAVRRVARPFIQGALRMLAGHSRDKAAGHWVRRGAKGRRCRDTRRDQEWTELWDDLDWFRVALADAEGWKDGLRSLFQATLDPAERLSDLEAAADTVYVGTDATQWSFAALHWATGRMLRELLTQEEHEMVRRHAEGGAGEPGTGRVRDALYIGILELAAVVYAAWQWGSEWQGKLVVVITDSNNALTWLRKGRCRNRYGQQLLRILARMAMRFGFEVWPERVSTEQNTLPDCACRRWREDGTIDTAQEARWKELLERYQGPALVEDVPVCEPQGERLWFTKLPWEGQGLRLPGEEPAWCEAALRTEAPPCLPTQPVKGRRAAGYDWSRRPTGGSPLLDRADAGYEARLARSVDTLWSSSLAASSSTKYKYDWNHWVTFCTDRKQSIWLTGADRRADVHLLVEYVADMGLLLGRAYSTIEGKLSAVRWYHLQAGLDNPLAGTAAVRAALRGLRRRQGDRDPKLPVTIEAMMHLRSRLDVQQLDHLVQWAAVITAFLFMMRASEYLADDAGALDADKVLLWQDVEFRWHGRCAPSHLGELPDEVVLHLRASKNDQFRAGASRNHFVSDHEEFCTVRALWALRERIGQVQGDQPVFMQANGRVLRRCEVSTLLKVAAVAVGMPAARVSSHSLRQGGATAMYHAGMQEAEIKWLGRWLSNAWMLHVHRTSGRSKGIATAMFNSTYQLLARPAGGV